MDITTAQAAEQLGVTRGRVLQYIWSGRLKARKIGRDYILDSRAVAAFRPLPPGRPARKKVTP